ncbi:MAG: thermonuclease family protein [Syntrophobacteraceae bacterium]
MISCKCKAVVIAFFGVLLLLPPACRAYTARVVGISGGGDVLTVSVNGSTRKVRLYGIECPRFGQPFHDKSLYMAKYLSLERDVEISPIFTDNYGLQNGLVRIQGSGQYLNSQLVGYGLAWVKPCDSKSPLCKEWKKIEGFAQMNFVGLWAQPPAIAPWEWRKAERKQILDRMKPSKKEKLAPLQ